jgi:hypothetical protein
MSTLQIFQMVAACCVIANFALNFFQINMTTIKNAVEKISENFFAQRTNKDLSTEQPTTKSALPKISSTCLVKDIDDCSQAERTEEEKMIEGNPSEIEYTEQNIRINNPK